MKLAAENRPMKYLRYAFGEILLVVIGILIALQINNWNTERILQNKKSSYLIDIVSDLKTDTSSFNRGIVFYKELIETKESVLLKTSYNETPTKKLEYLITPMLGHYRISDLTFQKTKNSGITSLTKNKELSEKIYNYYMKYTKWHDVMFDWEENYTYKEGDFWLYKQEVFEVTNSIGLPVIQDSVERRLLLIELITSPKGRNHLTLELERKKRVLQQLETMSKMASDLINDIQIELKITKG